MRTTSERTSTSFVLFTHVTFHAVMPAAAVPDTKDASGVTDGATAVVGPWADDQRWERRLSKWIAHFQRPTRGNWHHNANGFDCSDVVWLFRCEGIVLVAGIDELEAAGNFNVASENDSTSNSLVHSD